jgi:2-polyprenyl-3-methyl-5-hydroxy-6-metoxy-1,4-benzoquinol methylase
MSRYEIAKLVNPDVQPCSHDDFPGIAPRPIDTTYGEGARWKHQIYSLQPMRHVHDDRAAEISMFLGVSWEEAHAKLAQGFGPLHNAVSEDFRRANPQTEEELLNWYRTTEAYIWELSAYHEDLGFNYAGICQGIINGLKAHGVKSVLCLGDGIGDLTLAAHRAGMETYYHDLSGSRTAAYADFRHWRANGEGLPHLYTSTFSPTSGTWHLLQLDAIASLDFLEHVDCVEQWVRAIHAALKPGGIFCVQNAFAIGSGPQGDMPMHLACNDRFEKDWDRLLVDVGFCQLASNWYQKI